MGAMLLSLYIRCRGCARWFAALLALRFFYGVGGCAPWGPSPLRSQARCALPPAPTPAYVLAARFKGSTASCQLCAHECPLARRVPLAYRRSPPSETSFSPTACRYASLIAA